MALKSDFMMRSNNHLQVCFVLYIVFIFLFILMNFLNVLNQTRNR